MQCIENSWSLFWFLCGLSVGPVQAHQQHVWCKGRVRQICFSCLFNAPSSEAVLLFKPLKELRAKRKGTHLVDLHACAFFATFYEFLVFMRIHFAEKMKRFKLFIFALLSRMLVLLFFRVLFVKVCSLIFCFTERVNWNRLPSVKLTSCIDFDKCGQILLAESAWFSLRVSRDVCILRYPNGHHFAYIIFTDNAVSPLFQRQMWFWLWFYISWGHGSSSAGVSTFDWGYQNSKLTVTSVTIIIPVTWTWFIVLIFTIW